MDQGDEGDGETANADYSIRVAAGIGAFTRDEWNGFAGTARGDVETSYNPLVSFAFLSALVFVLIILYGWETIRSVMDRLDIGGDEEAEMTPEEATRLEQLESLKSLEEIPEAEKEALLESLTSDDDISHEEKMELLDKLKGDETP